MTEPKNQCAEALVLREQNAILGAGGGQDIRIIGAAGGFRRASHIRTHVAQSARNTMIEALVRVIAHLFRRDRSGILHPHWAHLVGGESQRCGDVGLGDGGVSLKEGFNRHARRELTQNQIHPDPRASDAGFADQSVGVDGDARVAWDLGHGW